MKKENSKRSAFGNSGTPWCETCRAYRKISVKGGKKTCSNCGQASIFVPAHFLTAALVCGGLCGIFLLITALHSLGIVLVPAILFGLGSLGGYIQYKKWAQWTREDAVRKKRLKRRKKKAEKREEARKAKAGETLSSPHPPVPPPLPPDADVDED